MCQSEVSHLILLCSFLRYFVQASILLYHFCLVLYFSFARLSFTVTAKLSDFFVCYSFCRNRSQESILKQNVFNAGAWSIAKFVLRRYLISSLLDKLLFLSLLLSNKF